MRKKTHMRKNNFFHKSFKNIKNTTEKILPKVQVGLENIGTVVTNAAIKGLTILQKGFNSYTNKIYKTRHHKSIHHKQRCNKTRCHKPRRNKTKTS